MQTGKDHIFGIGLMFGFPFVFSMGFLMIYRNYEKSVILGIVLALIGAALIIKSKKSEAFTIRWKYLGPPQDESKRKTYKTGYIVYVTGLVILLMSLVVK